MKKLFRILFKLILLGTVILAVFIAVMWAKEWKPEAIETVLDTEFFGSEVDSLRVGDTLTVVSWNIGYAGLGDDMDFFVDGGSRMRTSRERTEKNLNGIVAFLDRYSGVADFILLQEVDFDSKRSYGMNQYDSIRSGLAGAGYYGWWGINYQTDYVPIPVTRPMGKVKSGIVILSKWKPREVTRFQYPSRFPFPVRLFNLKRCMLSASVPVAGEDGTPKGMLYINNTHNSAFDKSGGMRRDELDFMRRYLEGKPYSVTMGDWNSTPPGYEASAAALTDKYFQPHVIDRAYFPLDMHFVYDPTTPSVRYGYEPYDPQTTTTTVVDFALSGSRLEPVAFETIDLGFRNSDHNPIVARFVIR